MAVFCTPTVNGFGRFSANALAPLSVLWGRDNRGAMLLVIGGPATKRAASRTRIGEPSANPYLYMAAQIHAGLDGIARRREPPPGTNAPYAGTDPEALLPTSLPAALQTLDADAVLREGFGAAFVDYYRRSRPRRRRATTPPRTGGLQAREYFSRM